MDHGLNLGSAAPVTKNNCGKPAPDWGGEGALPQFTPNGVITGARTSASEADWGTTVAGTPNQERAG